MTYRAILVGTGGQGASWCERFLPPNVEDGLVEVVAAVDVDADALANAREHLDVPPDRCYGDAATAFDEVEADFCIVVVPPWVHEEVIEAALARDLHVLSEKPIADTLDASVRVADAVERAGVKMGVTMSHRFDRDKATLRRELESGVHGPLDYLVCRFTCNAREFGAWGAFRHEMDDPLLVEGGVHHLDLLADLARAGTGGDEREGVARCTRLYAETWTPEWGAFAGPAQALVTMGFDDAGEGVRATYEGAKTNAQRLNGWTHEYVRAECRDATLVLDGRDLRAYPHDPDGATVGGSLAADERSGGERGAPVDLAGAPDDKWANALLVEQFVEWLDGGERMATHVADNVQSMALVEAAVESGETGVAVDPQALLADARNRVLE